MHSYPVVVARNTSNKGHRSRTRREQTKFRAAKFTATKAPTVFHALTPDSWLQAFCSRWAEFLRQDLPTNIDVPVQSNSGERIA